MLACPSPRCRSENATGAAACRRCGLPLTELALLAGHHARLFNQGLAAAKENRLQAARDLMSAVVEWCPHDLEARNALALLALKLDDRETARRHWETVLGKAASNRLALGGVAYLQRLQETEAAAKASRASGAKAVAHPGHPGGGRAARRRGRGKH
jgi:Flp pilus assembly protein TadD